MDLWAPVAISTCASPAHRDGTRDETLWFFPLMSFPCSTCHSAQRPDVFRFNHCAGDGREMTESNTILGGTLAVSQGTSFPGIDELQRPDLGQIEFLCAASRG